MSRYAENTTVSSEKSRAEIERTLVRYGADQFAYGWSDEGAMIGFRLRGKMVRFILPMPERGSKEFTRTETGRMRTASSAQEAYEKAVRQRWRALALVIKAKLEAVASGIVTFDDEFMPHILLPDGQRFGDWAQPQIDRAYEEGTMPQLLPRLKEIEA